MAKKAAPAAPAKAAKAAKTPAKAAKSAKAPAAKASAAKAPAAKASAASATVTLKHIAAQLASEHEVSKKQAEGMLTGMIDHVVKNLKKGSRVRLVGLGILQVKKRAARMGRNPATGEQIKIKASKKVAFRAAKELKEAV
ncbi:MAG: family DNA-binding protein [Hyphomicrobiales bacterium]|nr:family DNA-binding protein [Hyphomicrobiales bacterium]